MKRLLAAIFCVPCMGAITEVRADHAETQRVSRLAAGWPIDAFTLVDQRGEPFTQQQLQGRWTFVLLGDVRCGEPCTSALSTLAGMYRRIARTEAMKTTQVLFISLDPERDTATQLRKYLAPFDERFIGAIGSRQTLRRLTDDMGVSARVLAQPRSISAGSNNYSGSLLLIGPDGSVRSEFLPPFDLLLLTAEYLKTRVRR
jgi:protein SCO1/2